MKSLHHMKFILKYGVDQTHFLNFAAPCLKRSGNTALLNAPFPPTSSDAKKGRMTLHALEHPRDQRDN